MTAGHPRVDPQLRRRLDDAVGTGRVEAVVTLASPGATPEPEEVRKRVSSLLEEVAGETGSDEYEFNVFGYLGTFAIAAQPDFLKCLLTRKEVASATSNRAT